MGRIRQIVSLSGTGQDAAVAAFLLAMIAYWPGNEAAGNLIDAHTNGLDLTDVNTVTSNPGLVYATARQYTVANAEYHTRPGDDALLSLGDNDITIATWVRADSLNTNRRFVTKMSGVGAGDREYSLHYTHSTAQFNFYVCQASGAIIGSVVHVLSDPVQINQWYLILASHDAVNNLVGIIVDNAGSVTAATGGIAPADTVQPFRIGAYSAGLLPWSGCIGPTMFWKSVPGDGGVLTAAQGTWLYNDGAGRTYAEIVAHG